MTQKFSKKRNLVTTQPIPRQVHRNASEIGMYGTRSRQLYNHIQTTSPSTPMESFINSQSIPGKIVKGVKQNTYSKGIVGLFQKILATTSEALKTVWGIIKNVYTKISETMANNPLLPIVIGAIFSILIIMYVRPGMIPKVKMPKVKMPKVN